MEQVQKGPSAQETLSGETKERDVEAEKGRESKAGDPHPEKWGGGSGGLKENKERQRQRTNQGKAGRGAEVRELGSFVGSQGERPEGI